MEMKFDYLTTDWEHYIVERNFGVFGNNDLPVFTWIIRTINNLGVNYLIIDPTGLLRENNKSNFYRLGSDVYLDPFEDISSVDELLDIINLMEAGLLLSSEEGRYLFEALLNSYLENSEISIEEIIYEIKSLQSLTSGTQTLIIDRLIRALQPLTIGPYFKKSVNKGLIKISDIVESPAILDISILPDERLKGLAQLLILRRIVQENIKELLVSYPRINYLLPSKGIRYDHLRKRILIFERYMDMLYIRGINIAISENSLSNIHQSVISRLETLILLRSELVINNYKIINYPFTLNYLPDDVALMISYHISNPVLIKVKHIELREVDKITPEHALSKPILPTFLEALVKEHANIIAELLELLKLSFITRNNAIKELRWRGYSSEEASDLIDLCISKNLIDEKIVSGRRILTLTWKGRYALNEYKLKRGDKF